QPELLDTSFDFSPRKSRFVTEPEIQCEALSHSEIILGIYASEDVAVVLEFSRALAERKVAAVVAKLARKKIIKDYLTCSLACAWSRITEAKFGGLEEQIVQIDAAALKNAAKTKIVFSLHPTDIIAPSEIVSDECCLGVVTKAESTKIGRASCRERV